MVAVAMAPWRGNQRGESIEKFTHTELDALLTTGVRFGPAGAALASYADDVAPLRRALCERHTRNPKSATKGVLQVMDTP